MTHKFRLPCPKVSATAATTVMEKIGLLCIQLHKNSPHFYDYCNIKTMILWLKWRLLGVSTKFFIFSSNICCEVSHQHWLKCHKPFPYPSWFYEFIKSRVKGKPIQLSDYYVLAQLFFQDYTLNLASSKQASSGNPIRFLKVFHTVAGSFCEWVTITFSNLGYINNWSIGNSATTDIEHQAPRCALRQCAKPGLGKVEATLSDSILS